MKRYTTENLEEVVELREGLLSRAADFAYAFRFLKLLVTPWEKTQAFKLGVLDKNGRVILRPKDFEKDDRENSTNLYNDRKSAYTVFHRLVFNIKRLINKVPGIGKSRLASYAAALLLIKEHTGMSEESIANIMDKVDENDWDNIPLEEATWFMNKKGNLNPGSYRLNTQIAHPETGEIIAYPEDVVICSEEVKPMHIFNYSCFEVTHAKTNQKIIVGQGDISR
tara:strand:- start:2237 stop:2908 length:672 start_codon:yes stop_codon:yes gene_type:complete